MMEQDNLTADIVNYVVSIQNEKKECSELYADLFDSQSVEKLLGVLFSLFIVNNFLLGSRKILVVHSCRGVHNFMGMILEAFFILSLLCILFKK